MKLRSLTALAAAGLVLAATPSAMAGPAFSAFQARSLCGDTCGSFSTTTGSAGVLRETAKGVTWGTVVGLSTIRVTPNTTATTFDVTGASSRWRDGAARVFRGRGMKLLASGAWTVSVNGTDIRISTVATGAGYVAGSGRYYLNGGRAQTWPSKGKYLTLRK
jgi:hypothetical protein